MRRRIDHEGTVILPEQRLPLNAELRREIDAVKAKLATCSPHEANALAVALIQLQQTLIYRLERAA